MALLTPTYNRDDTKHYEPKKQNGCSAFPFHIITGSQFFLKITFWVDVGFLK